MATIIRPEVSKKNKYYISKHRYYELYHFCLQYGEWKECLSMIDGLSRAPGEFGELCSKERINPTEKAAEMREYYISKIYMVEETAKDTDALIGPYILKAVTEELSYEVLNARERVPTNREYYYELYRRFFWLLDFRRA